MKAIYKVTAFSLLLLLSAACGREGSQSESKTLNAKRKELEAAQQELDQLRARIIALEKEIRTIDPLASRSAISVAVFPASQRSFEHRIEVRGSVQSRKNIQIGAQTPGVVEKVLVEDGQRVSGGQLLLALNADVLRSTIAEYKTALELAKAVYERQEMLWSKKIGSEVRYLEAKNSKESLERKLSTAQAQLRQTQVRAPFTGTVEHVAISEGEFAMTGAALVKVTSNEAMYIQADISERYLGRFRAGDSVRVIFPIQEKTFWSTIRSVGEVINSQNRTFEIELKLPRTGAAQSPNQVVVVSLRDYYQPRAWVIPTRVIQQDDKGHFVFCIRKENGKTIARKAFIEVGESYDGHSETLAGLTNKDQVVYEGFRELVDGNEVAISTQPSEAQAVNGN